MSDATNQCESIEDALIEAIKALGGSKEVGKIFKPERAADAAGRWLRDCLNAECRDKLEIGQILYILREAQKVGCHAAINFICSDAGYDNPKPIQPEDELSVLLREFNKNSRMQIEKAGRIESLMAANQKGKKS